MSVLYKNPTAFHDIISGTSTGNPPYSAGAGYDYVTGMGTPIASVVVGSLVGPTTATLQQEDTTTQGNWIGAYGSQGYDIVSGPTSLPSYAALTTIGASTYTWSSSATKPSALQLPGSSSHVAAVWYSATSFAINLVRISLMARHMKLHYMQATMTTRGARNRFRSRMPQPERSSTRKVSPISPAGSIYNGRSPAAW